MQAPSSTSSSPLSMKSSSVLVTILVASVSSVLGTPVRLTETASTSTSHQEKSPATPPHPQARSQSQPSNPTAQDGGVHRSRRFHPNSWSNIDLSPQEWEGLRIGIRKHVNKGVEEGVKSVADRLNEYRRNQREPGSTAAPSPSTVVDQHPSGNDGPVQMPTAKGQSQAHAPTMDRSMIILDGKPHHFADGGKLTPFQSIGSSSSFEAVKHLIKQPSSQHGGVHQIVQQGSPRQFGSRQATQQALLAHTLQGAHQRLGRVYQVHQQSSQRGELHKLQPGLHRFQPSSSMNQAPSQQVRQEHHQNVQPLGGYGYGTPQMVHQKLQSGLVHQVQPHQASSSSSQASGRSSQHGGQHEFRKIAELMRETGRSRQVAERLLHLGPMERLQQGQHPSPSSQASLQRPRPVYQVVQHGQHHVSIQPSRPGLVSQWQPVTVTRAAPSMFSEKHRATSLGKRPREEESSSPRWSPVHHQSDPPATAQLIDLVGAHDASSSRIADSHNAVQRSVNLVNVDTALSLGRKQQHHAVHEDVLQELPYDPSTKLGLELPSSHSRSHAAE